MANARGGRGRFIAHVLCAGIAACGIDATGRAPGAALDVADAGAQRSDAVEPASPADGSLPAVDAGLADADGTDAALATDAGAASAGHALRFDGDDYVDVASLVIPADFTIEAWVNPASFPGEDYVVAKDRDQQAAGQLRFGFENNGRLFFVMSDSSGDDHGLYAGGGYALRSAGAVPKNVWSHVAVTKSGAVFTLYLGSSSVTFTADASFVYGGPAVPFRIGGRVASTGSGINGGCDCIVDDVRLWSVARTAVQLAGSRTTPPPLAATGLTAWFRFDEGSGTTTTDAKGGLVGTLSGPPSWITSTAY